MIGIVTGLVAEARIARSLGTALAGGGTPEGAADAAERLIAQGATALISFGLAGGLNPALPAGTLVVPAHIETETARYDTNPALTARLGGPHYRLFAGQAIAATAAAKQAMFSALGVDAIDLESGAVALVAARHGVPVAALRAICDPAGTTLPPVALLALNAAGAISPVRVMGSLLVHPGQIPALLRLAHHASLAHASLVQVSKHFFSEEKKQKTFANSDTGAAG